MTRDEDSGTKALAEAERLRDEWMVRALEEKRTRRQEQERAEAAEARVLELDARVKELEGMLDDAGRGSTHELVRYWLEKTIAAEAEAVRLRESIECARKIVSEPLPAGSPELRLASDVRAALGSSAPPPTDHDLDTENREGETP